MNALMKLVIGCMIAFGVAAIILIFSLEQDIHQSQMSNQHTAGQPTLVEQAKAFFSR